MELKCNEIIGLELEGNLEGFYLIHPTPLLDHFTGQETEVKRGGITYSKSPRELSSKPEFYLSLLSPNSVFFLFLLEHWEIRAERNFRIHLVQSLYFTEKTLRCKVICSRLHNWDATGSDEVQG